MLSLFGGWWTSPGLIWMLTGRGALRIIPTIFIMCCIVFPYHAEFSVQGARSWPCFVFTLSLFASSRKGTKGIVSNTDWLLYLLTQIYVLLMLLWSIESLLYLYWTVTTLTHYSHYLWGTLIGDFNRRCSHMEINR